MKAGTGWKHEAGAGYERWTREGHEIVLVKLTEAHKGKWRATHNGSEVSGEPFQTRGAALTALRRVFARIEKEVRATLAAAA